jgi:hypothetical protein
VIDWSKGSYETTAGVELAPAAEVVVQAAGIEPGLRLDTSSRHELPIRAASPEAYVTAGDAHPMAAAVLPAIRAAGAEGELREAQLAVLAAAKEAPGAFLVHSPYVVHELRPVR